MAVEKGKVLIAIETKFKGKSISKTFKDNLATKWAAKIDNDTDIDSYVDDREDVVLEAVREADQRVTDALKKVPSGKDDKKPEDKEEVVKVDEDAPQWAKDLAKQNLELSQKLSGFQAQQSQQSLADRFKANPELKGIPEFMLKGRIPQSEEEFDTAVEELKADYTTFANENKLANIGKDTPAGGNTPANPNDGKIDPAIEAFAKKELITKN